MNDSLRESLSYFGLYRKMFQVKRKYKPEMVSYGKNKEQYFLYYEPEKIVSDKIIVWIHGGGWNAGNPRFFDFVGQCVCDQGYRDVSKIIIAGPSAGAHLASIMCYCRKVQEKYKVDVSNVIGFIGSGGPYSFREDQSLTVRLLLGQLFREGYDRRNGEPVMLMGKSSIPMLLIQSRHDGLIEYACAEDFAARAEELGNVCELYSVTDKKNTHSWYTAGMFLETRAENKGLDKFFSWIEER